jgi:hypothetical protein
MSGLYITDFDATHSYAGSPGIYANWFYCNTMSGCLVHVKNSQVAVGASGYAFVSFAPGAGDVFAEEGGNNISGPVSWQGTATVNPTSTWASASLSGIQPTISSSGTGTSPTNAVDAGSTNEKLHSR